MIVVCHTGHSAKVDGIFFPFNTMCSPRTTPAFMSLFNEEYFMRKHDPEDHQCQA
jgi:hypothetical protein